jgi:hypothetical protein
MPLANSARHDFQWQFHQRWDDLHDQHVRALAWLLCAPDLLDRAAPPWRHRLASLQDLPPMDIDAWLHGLDRDPEPLHRYLGVQPFVRLGRYAEKLMAFHLAQCGVLVAHGLQVQSEQNQTVGEFDFLLRLQDKLVHWEFATKFYLLAPSAGGRDADYFVGPNLADTLGAKMHKIFDRQLSLSAHPAARTYLPEPVAAARALVKGWLFYQDDSPAIEGVGTSPDHCRGFWRTAEELAGLDGERYAILSRLDWLAPARIPAERTMDLEGLRRTLSDYFSADSMPVMIVTTDTVDGVALETSRGFVVPDDWQLRANGRTRPSLL